MNLELLIARRGGLSAAAGRHLKSTLCGVLLFVLQPNPGLAAAQAHAEDFPARVEALVAAKTISSNAERRRAIVALYRSEFDANLEVQHPASLQKRLDGALYAAFYSNDRGIAGEAALIHGLLDAQGELRDNDTAGVVASLIRVREFTQADDLARVHGLARLPPVRWDASQGQEGRRRVIAVEDDHITVRYVDEDVIGNGIVVVSNPLCAYSAAASAALFGDPSLSAIFSNAVWLVPPEGKLHAPEIMRWNSEHQANGMMAFDVSEWPEIDYWSTPTFYFYVNGQVIDQVRGWPLDGRNAPRVRAAVERWKQAKARAQP